MGFVLRQRREEEDMRAWMLDAVGEPVRPADVPEPKVRPGGGVIDVLAAPVPAYTREVTGGSRGYVPPTPLVLGPTCIGRVTGKAGDVFGVEVGNVVMNSSLLTAGEDEILVGWTGVG